MCTSRTDMRLASRRTAPLDRDRGGVTSLSGQRGIYADNSDKVHRARNSKARDEGGGERKRKNIKTPHSPRGFFSKRLTLIMIVSQEAVLQSGGMGGRRTIRKKEGEIHKNADPRGNDKWAKRVREVCSKQLQLQRRLITLIEPYFHGS